MHITNIQTAQLHNVTGSKQKLVALVLLLSINKLCTKNASVQNNYTSSINCCIIWVSSPFYFPPLEEERDIFSPESVSVNSNMTVSCARCLLRELTDFSSNLQ